MTGILLIRHGDTDWNKDEIFRGWADIELNDTGIRQAKLLAGYLADAGISVIYSSPLKRALKTAQTIAEHHNININIASELIDFNYGEWQGMSRNLVEQKYKPLYDEWLKNPHLVRMPGGESLDDVTKRAVSLVDRVIPEHEGIIAFVSHRVINKAIICALMGLDNSHFWNIRLDTCGITSFAYESGKYILTGHNDVSFLKSMGNNTARDF